jgi:hypothetical protein
VKPVREVVSREIIDDLWGAGYTILPRKRHPDPFFVPPEIVPATRSYQWWYLVHDKALFEHTGWAAVPASRHDGYFMPAGFVGNIEVEGLGLFEKPKFEVDAERAARHTKAHQNVTDWVKEQGAAGFSGEFRVGPQFTEVGKVERHDTKTIETTVQLPPDMLPHMAEVFAERDRLYTDLQVAANVGTTSDRQTDILQQYHEALKDDPIILKGPTFNALLLPWAIENVRKQLASDNEARKKS